MITKCYPVTTYRNFPNYGKSPERNSILLYSSFPFNWQFFYLLSHFAYRGQFSRALWFQLDRKTQHNMALFIPYFLFTNLFTHIYEIYSFIFTICDIFVHIHDRNMHLCALLGPSSCPLISERNMVDEG